MLATRHPTRPSHASRLSYRRQLSGSPAAMQGMMLPDESSYQHNPPSRRCLAVCRRLRCPRDLEIRGPHRGIDRLPGSPALTFPAAKR